MSKGKLAADISLSAMEGVQRRSATSLGHGGQGKQERTLAATEEAGFQGAGMPLVVTLGETIVQGPRAADALVVVQGATALTASNPRRVGQWGKKRGAVLVGEREFSPLVRNRLDAGSAPMPEGCNGRAQRLPCQEVRYYRTHLAISIRESRMEDSMPWDFDRALNDPLITVDNRIDDWGTFEISIGSIPTIISIELGRHMTSDETKVSVSHSIHTPLQAGPYRTSRPYWDDPEYALQQTVSALIDWYSQAVRAGHTPSESWLVEN